MSKPVSKSELSNVIAQSAARAIEARKVAGVEMSAAEVGEVNGGYNFGGAQLSYLRDPSWYGIWDWEKLIELQEPKLPLVPAKTLIKY